MDPSLRALIATLAPARKGASALPRPWLAPVMSVTLPSNMLFPFGSISASQHFSTPASQACQHFSLHMSKPLADKAGQPPC